MSDCEDRQTNRSATLWLRSGRCFVFSQMVVNDSAVVADLCVAELPSPPDAGDLGRLTREAIARFREVQMVYDKKKETKAFLKQFGAKSEADLRRNTGHISVSENCEVAHIEITVWRPDGLWSIPAMEYGRILPADSNEREMGTAIWTALRISEWLNSPTALDPPEEVTEQA